MNKMFKRIVSVVLALVLVMGVLAISPYAATANIAVKTDKASYFQGDRVTATVYFPSVLNTLASLDMNLTYDSTKLELVSVENGKELDAALKAQVNGKAFSESHKQAGKIMWAIAGTNNFNFNGTFATVVFNVKTKAAAGKSALNLNVTAAANSGYVSMVKSITVQNASIEIEKVAANDLVFERTSDGKAYEIIGYHCVTVDNLTIPTKYAGLPVVGIIDGVFKSHAELKTVVLPDTLKYIGANAFSGCSGITTLTIPDSVEKIGAAAFKGCTKLESVTLPIGLETLENDTFKECSFLEKIEIPFTVTKIGSSVFADCFLLANVKISKRTTNIAANAFSGCPDGIVFTTVEGNTYLPTYIENNLSTAKTAMTKDISLGTATCDSDFSYTGSAIKPTVTVKLDNGVKVNKGREYKVVYRNNTERGIATVYVAGIGEYGEGYILTFNIKCGHTNIKKVIGKAATCTTDGYYNCTCASCGNVTKETIPAFGHTEGIWVIEVRPTIYATGLKHSECVDCRAVMRTNVVIPKAFPDLNNDKKINSTDALIVLQYATEIKNELTTQELLYNADTNGDGSINSGDALDILQIAIGKIIIEGYAA